MSFFAFFKGHTCQHLVDLIRLKSKLLTSAFVIELLFGQLSLKKATNFEIPKEEKIPLGIVYFKQFYLTLFGYKNKCILTSLNRMEISGISKQASNRKGKSRKREERVGEIWLKQRAIATTNGWPQ